MYKHEKNDAWWRARIDDIKNLSQKDFAKKHDVNHHQVEKMSMKLLGRQRAEVPIQKKSRLWWADRIDDLKGMTSTEFSGKYDVPVGTADRKRREMIGRRYNKKTDLEEKIKAAVDFKRNGNTDEEAAKIMQISTGYLRKLRHLAKEAAHDQ